MPINPRSQLRVYFDLKRRGKLLEAKNFLEDCNDERLTAFAEFGDVLIEEFRRELQKVFIDVNADRPESEG